MNLKAIESAVANSAPRSSGLEQGIELEIRRIFPNPDQPRKHFDPLSIEELAESIREHGLLQPIVVARRENGYMIVAGERRYRAHRIIGSTTIRAIISEGDAARVDEAALIENIQREDLSDFEIAKAIGKLWGSGRYGRKQDLAAKIGKPPSYVSKALGCLRIDESIREDIETHGRDIGLTVLEEIARMDDAADQQRAYEGYVSGTMTRSDFKSVAKKESPEKISPGKKKHTVWVKGSDVNALLGTHYEPDQKYKLTIEEA